MLLAKILFQAEEKILVTGPWYSQTSPYQILFDGIPVPTTLVQSGVLRCFCPGQYSHHQLRLTELTISKALLLNNFQKKASGTNKNINRKGFFLFYF